MIDLRGIVSYTDYLVICSGGTERQTKAIHDAVYERLKHEDGLLPRRTEGEREARWILLDYLDCVLHIFTPEAREYTAWSSSGARRRAAPWVDLRRPEGVSRDRRGSRHAAGAVLRPGLRLHPDPGHRADVGRADVGGPRRGDLVLAALWWAWSAYAWLTNEIDTDDTLDRLALFASMAAFLIAALAAPQAMEDDALIFGLAYLGVRLLHVLLFAVASRDVDAAEAMRRLWATAIPAPLLLVAAGLVDQGTTRTLLWILALAIDFSGPYIRGVEGFRVSAAYFAERYALIIIIALGESIVAVGAGLAGDELDAGVLLAAALGMVIAACFWWAYFDVVAVVAERRFKAAPRAEQNRIARDSYSYLHLPMIAGIVLVALGVKKTLGDVGEPLKTIPAVALCRRHRVLPGSRRLPAAQRRLAQSAATRGCDRGARADSGGQGGGRGRGPWADRRADDDADGVRGDPLSRGQGADPRGRGGLGLLGIDPFAPADGRS